MGIGDFFKIDNLASFVGGLIIIFWAVWQIVEKAFGNISWIKNIKEKKEKEKREKREKEITTYINDIILPSFLNKIADINNEQNTKLDCLLKSTNDTMRIELLRAYFRYRKYKKIPQWAKEASTHLHDDYVAQEGNSFVADLWKQMMTWEVVPSEDDIFIDDNSREEI